jgi:hypothetical protein
VRRSEGYFCKVCRVCGWQAEQFGVEVLEGEERFRLYYNCEISGVQSCGRRHELSHLLPRKLLKELSQNSKDLDNSSNYEGLNWTAIPVRRYSLARRDQPVPRDDLGLERFKGLRIF